MRVENLDEKFDYVVNRAVADMSTLMGWVWNKIRKGKAGSLPAGILSLKGGDLREEFDAAGRRYEIFDISDLYDEDFFATKKIVHIPR